MEIFVVAVETQLKLVARRCYIRHGLRIYKLPHYLLVLSLLYKPTRRSCQKMGKYLPMSARSLLYQKSTREAVISFAAFLQEQELFVHVAHRFLGLQHHYKTMFRIAVRKENLVF